MALSGSARAVDELLGVKPSFLDSIVGDSRDNGFGNTHANTYVETGSSKPDAPAVAEEDREWANRSAVMAQLAAQRAVAETVAPVEALDPAVLAGPVVAAEVEQVEELGDVA